ncbi:MAG: FkbM family methyltransferase [Bacilli bacterium]|nr:FkbM family methyltransferase [Bacilli bacterium]
MNIIDTTFYNLVNQIKSLSEKEIYHKMRQAFDQVPEEMQRSFMNFFNQFGYWGLLDIDKNNYEEIELKSSALFHHIDDFVWMYEHLNDYRSKKTLYSILSNWFQYDFDTSSKTREILFDDYFDLDIVKCDENEVIVDLGAYTGDTILSYLHNYGLNSYKKIYCYEITPETFEVLKENLKPYPNIECRLKGIGDELTSMSVNDNEESSSANTLKTAENGSVTVTTLDQDIKEPITLIKADIEGFEQKAIKGCLEHIKKDHPKLLISVYHNNEDLWKIAKMIYEVHDDYKFYLRYNSYPTYPTEITLIAI